MKALILDGSKEGDGTLKLAREIIENELKKYNWCVTSFILRDINVAPCKGCFGCWVKTPGICVICDAGRDVARAMAQSNLLVFLTPIIFGGYSPELKKAIDRIICVVLPFFMKIKGEVHHKPRYLGHKHLLAIGLVSNLDGEIEATFENLVMHNAINCHALSHTCKILLAKDEKNVVEEKIKAALVQNITK